MQKNYPRRSQALRLLYAVLLGGLLLHACKKDDPNPRYTPPPSLKEYFPLKPGMSWIYELDSLVYNGNSTKVFDSAFFQIKEVVVARLDSSTAGEQYRMERYKRQHEGDKWVLDRSYIAGISDLSADINENNRRLIKLMFPVQEGKSWDAHQYTTDSATERSRYLWVNNKYTVGSLSFDSAARVELQYDSSFINRNVHYETYGYRVGLLESTYDSLEIQTDALDPSIVMWRGIRVTKKLLKHE